MNIYSFQISFDIAVITELLSVRASTLKGILVPVFLIIPKPISFDIVVAVDAEPPLPITKIVLFSP